MANENLQHLKQGQTWLRGLYMLLFAVFYYVAKIVLTVLVIFQFLALLFTGQTNARLLKLGQSLSTYVYQIWLFLSFNTEAMPYPLGVWPRGEPEAAASRPAAPGSSDSPSASASTSPARKRNTRKKKTGGPAGE